MKRLQALVFTLAFGGATTVIAQLPERRVLPWTATTKSSLDPARTKAEVSSRSVDPVKEESAPMSGEVYYDMDRGGIPLWTPAVTVPQGSASFKVALEDAVWEPVPEALLKRYPLLDEVGEVPVIRTHIATQRKETVGSVVVEPFKRNNTTGKVERLLEARLRYFDVVQGGPVRPKSYPASSKLAAGSWYRMSVPDNGVYKVTYQTLVQLGVDVGNLGSDRINIYGNHTGMLPFQNDALPATDLRANAIEVVDGGDGVFGPGDHLLFYASGPQRWAPGGKGFAHTKNVYCDSAHYFVGIDVEPAVTHQERLL